VALAPSVRNRGGAKKGTGVNVRVRNRLITQSEVKPLNVMMELLAERYKAAQAITDDQEARQKAMDSALAVAEKVAPYLHPKLQATTIKGDADNPLSFAVSLPDSLLLMAAIRGKKG
jgi:predicted component of type VI protein secretion system